MNAASPGLAKSPAAGKRDADSEKQPKLSVWTTLEHAGWPILATS